MTLSLVSSAPVRCLDVVRQVFHFEVRVFGRVDRLFRSLTLAEKHAADIVARQIKPRGVAIFAVAVPT